MAGAVLDGRRGRGPHEAARLENGALVLGCCEGELLVGLDEGQHGIVVGRRAVACNVAVNAALGRSAALGKLFNQLVAQQLMGGRGLDELQQELGRAARLLSGR